MTRKCPFTRKHNSCVDKTKLLKLKFMLKRLGDKQMADKNFKGKKMMMRKKSQTNYRNIEAFFGCKILD